jgi:uncharacterized glyoxalase superfamily protein PhnB
VATLGVIIPVLRIFDEQKAREFYLAFLGFKVDFEHRFGDNFPLYMGISHCGCRLHLSEHHGDGAPGIQIRIEADDVAGFAASLAAKDYRYAKPGAPERTPWDTIELCITDPFGNRLRFVQTTTPAE